MNSSLVTGAALAAIALLLFGCGGGHDGNSNAGTGGTSSPSTPKVSVQDLPSGSYTVSVGDAQQPTVGKYYAGDDGSRLLLLAKPDDSLDTLYRRTAGASEWSVVPAASADVRLVLLRSDAMPVQSADVAALAGSYAAALPDGSAVRFALGADGSIAAGNTACKLTGRLEAGTLPSTLKLSLKAAACSGMPASSAGVLVIDNDYSPARFRLVADNGSQSLDLWAYKE